MSIRHSARSPAVVSSVAPSPAALPPVQFKVTASQVNAHLFELTLQVKQPEPVQRLSLPVWIPGSYLVREFSKNLQHLAARQGNKTLEVAQLNKNTWQVTCEPAKTLTVSYQIYALDNSVRTAWLDSSRGFFNGTSLFLQVNGRTDAPHEVEITAPRLPLGAKKWQLATGLTPVKTNAAGFGRYAAATYDELVDCPVEMGDFYSGSFTACGVPHRFVVAGASPSLDGARLLADAQKICEEEIRFWHPNTDKSSDKKTAKKTSTLHKPPHKNYVFMLNAVDDGYGGLEHRNSTALICNRKDLPRVGDKAFANGKQTEGYTTLLGLISHEYFHTWNVKCLRPSEFAEFDYGAENYTQLLWFFEGFTSYYDDLLLRRAGLIDDTTYLKLVNKTINQVMQTPGRLVQSVAQSSFDAWVKYYRQDENTPNATVSYYTKGALVALCLDLSLRQEGKTTLDDVMRALWARCAGGPMQEADLLAVLLQLAGRSFEGELQTWVHSTAELPLKPLLENQGVAVFEDPAQLAQVLGLRVHEANGIVIKTVLRGGAAEAAGFAAGDEWVGVALRPDLEKGAGTRGKPSSWRLHKLDELSLYVGAVKQFDAIVSRDRQLLNLPVTLPESVTTWRLAVRDAERLRQWLAN